MCDQFALDILFPPANWENDCEPVLAIEVSSILSSFSAGWDKERSQKLTNFTKCQNIHIVVMSNQSITRYLEIYVIFMHKDPLRAAWPKDP